MKINNQHMQEIGIHYMGSDINYTESEEEKKVRESKLQESLQEEQNHIKESIQNEYSNIKNTETTKIKATGYNVIFTKYNKNPYKTLKTSASGLIFSSDILSKEYISQDTGERTSAEIGIVCGKAISVGPECKYIKEGDDFYMRNIGVSLPFGNLNYEVISEQNIICTLESNE